MAAGTVTSTDKKRTIKLIENVTANSAVPTAATDGHACYPTEDQKVSTAAETWCFYPFRDAGQSTLNAYGTVNAGQVLAVTLTLWGYLAAAGKWFEIPLNGGTPVTPVALAETDTDIISFQQRLENLGHYDRLYLQVTGISGTGASINAWLTTGKYGQ